MNLTVNEIPVIVESAWRDESLLHWLREARGLVGARFGCGVGLCGACTVLLDGDAVRACMVRVADVGARRVTTIEGLASDTGLHPVQRAWLETNVPQCGYCQSGQIMSTVALLRRVPAPTDADIDAALAGNLCRCGTYQRIRVAVRRAEELAS